jgi:hypothetical protein
VFELKEDDKILKRLQEKDTKAAIEYVKSVISKLEELDKEHQEKCKEKTKC